MVRRAGMITAWIVATLLSMFIASQAVGGVRDRVIDQPADLPESVAASVDSPSDPQEPAAGAVDSTAADDPTAQPQAAPVVSPDEPAGGEDSPDDDAAEPLSPGVEAVTTTTPPDESPPPVSTSTTTTVTSPPTTAAPFEFARYNLTGGFVELKFRPGEVYLVGATPNPGYEVSVAATGPGRVEVEFESSDDDDPYEGELDASWDNGELDVDVDERFEEG